jgi:S-ribosylhomocysteine lyase
MIKTQTLGWDPSTVGELDHRLLKAPTLKLRSARPGPGGDVVYSVDLRLKRPNTGDVLSILEMHSLEHFLLEGFTRYLPENFISVGLMGCQTGFYLVFLNEGRAQVLSETLEKILNDILAADGVPYERIDQCGNYHNHSLAPSQSIAREVLDAKAGWLDVA